MKNKIIVLTGKSASGKDTLARLLEKEGYSVIVSTTTRPIRDGELNGVAYNFITKKDFIQKLQNDEFIEHRSYNTLMNNKPDVWYYGVEKSEVKEDVCYVVVLDTVGLIDFKDYFKKRVVSLYINVDDNIRKDRCIKRGDFNTFEWDRRLIDDKDRFSDTIIKKVIDHTINGECLESELLSRTLEILKDNGEN